MAEWLSGEYAGMIIKAILAVIFLIDIFLLSRNDRQKKIKFAYRTTMKQEITRNLVSVASFLMAFLVLLYMDIYMFDHNQGTSTISIGLDIAIIILMVVYFLVPKKVAIGEEGIFQNGTFYHWKQFRKVRADSKMVVLHRDRFFLLPPIRLEHEKIRDIHELAVAKIGKKEEGSKGGRE